MSSIPKGYDRISVYRDSASEWRWHRKAANNETISDSGEGYDTMTSAVIAAERANGVKFPAHQLFVDTPQTAGESIKPTESAERKKREFPPFIGGMVLLICVALLMYHAGRKDGDDHGYKTGYREGAVFEHEAGYLDGRIDGNEEGYKRGVAETKAQIAKDGFITELCPSEPAHTPAGMGDITGDGISDTQMPVTP